MYRVHPCTYHYTRNIKIQEILKQKSKNKKPKTFGAVNNAYEIYHILKCGYCRRSVFTIDKYFHKIYDNIIQINDKCYILR